MLFSFGMSPDIRKPIRMETLMTRGRVMIIGLDAATFDLLRPWADEGRLPNLASMLKVGASAPPRSTRPAMSPTAWSTFATGVNPGKHGILGFYQFHPRAYTPQLINAASRRGRTFWETAGEQGVRGGIINVPFTYPPRPFNGFLVSGMLSPAANRHIVTPPEVFDDLIAASPHYSVDLDFINTSGRDPSAFLDRVIRNLRARLEGAVGLYRKHRPDLFCTVFVAPDRVSHFFWPYLEAARAGRSLTPRQERLANGIRSIYEELDRAVGTLIEEAGEDTDVLIISDHGAGPLRKGLNLIEALARANLLTRKKQHPLDRVRQFAVWAFAEHAPGSLKRWVKARFPGLSESAAEVVSCGDVDFPRTRAYPAGETEGVFVNVRGRQPTGIVELGREYEETRQEIIDTLCNLTDPDTGERIARGAWRREEIWSGPCLEDLPDVIMEQEERKYAVPVFPKSHDDRILYPLPSWSWKALRHLGGHRRHGILMAAGPHIRNTSPAEARIVDVPATVLALLGCAVPEAFDGRVLTEMLTEDVPTPDRTRVLPSGEAPSEDVQSQEHDAVTERLRNLGYI